MTATSGSATGLYIFFACWLAAAIVLGFALYYVWDRLERRSRQVSHRAEGTADP
jgi:hypothetical protein